MASVDQLILYTRADCHLCEVAAQVLDAAGISWSAVDIDSDPELVRKYGIRIPVVHRPDVRRDLYWPFTGEALAALLESEER